MSRPDSITGGCLCGSIRFKLSFPESAEWPPLARAICQCTMCRKHTGAIFPHMATFSIANITPALASNATFKLYKSSHMASRSFCSNCGSSIGYHEDAKPDLLDLHLGLIDEEWLCGKQVGGETREIGGTGSGKDAVKREKGLGKEICGPEKVSWRENDVPEVSEVMFKAVGVE